jgi:uncharacterized membrane protein
MIRKGLLLSLIPLAVIAAMGAWGYLTADPGGRFPVHWGLDGRPDHFSGRAGAFIGLPAVAFAVTVAMAVFPTLDTRGDNIRRSSQAYLTAWIGALSLLALVQTAVTMMALGVWDAGPDAPFHRLIAVAVSLLLVAIGNVLGKSRPNWFMGLRTPWTLSSDLAWERTHRLTGRLVVIVGLAGLAAAVVLPSGKAAVGLSCGVIATAMIGVVYSYIVWRRAADKRTGPQVVDS